MQDYLQGLNEQQREAVTHIDGPLMIVAGAGSGKTKVLTTRIAHLMAKGVDAFNILALTFTNKAAAEMKERIERILGNSEARNLYIGTFHSVFARILRAEAHKIGYPNNFTIYDTDDSRSVIKAVINEMELDDKHYKPNIVHNRISSAKNALVSAQEYALDYHLQQEDMRANRPAIAKIYKAYNDRCFKNGAMDFDDLLFKMYELLKYHNDALAKYQHKFKYVLIDEYQDTNAVQYQITKLLAAVHENICVVGDDAQSIYSFRGATIANILQFTKDYDDVKVVKLEQNYRSTKSILNVANEVISNNKGQLPKELWTDNDEGEKIKLVRTMTDNDEGKFVADTIQEQKLRNHFRNNEFAILYRTNAQSRAFEESLRRQGIKYKIYGGLSFYQRKEVKDLIAYLRIIVNPKDEEALKRIINYPVRGIGKTTIEKCLVFANTHNITFYNVLERAAEFGFKAGTLEAIQNFVMMNKYFQTLLTDKNAYDVANVVGKHTGLVKELFNDKTTEGLARYENIQELLNGIKDFTEQPDEDGELLDKSLGSYLQQVALFTDADKDNDDGNAVKLMTIHAAKGLEFSCVFVGGIEETLFPSAMSINTREELEEERRLFYVAVTRAKQKLWLTYANARYRFGQLQQNEPSRFINEMPDKHIDKSYAGGGARNTDNNWGNQGSAFQRMQRGFGFDDAAAAERKYGAPPTAKTSASKPAYIMPPSRTATVNHIASDNFEASDTSNLQAGQKVEHQKFGYGIVKTVEGSAHNPVATINFEKNGEKKIMLNYAKLRIVGLEQNNDILVRDLSIEKIVSIKFIDMNFQDNKICFQQTIPEISKILEFEIKNDFIRIEFDSVKEYFIKVLNSEFVDIQIILKTVGGNISFKKATSQILEQINQKNINEIKIEFIKSKIANSRNSENKPLTQEEVFQTVSKKKVTAKTFYDNDNALFDDIINIINPKHYKHLRYLASKHEYNFVPLKFILKPFSYLFFIKGQTQNHIIWETNDTEEATYIWHFEKTLEIPYKKIIEIEKEVSMIIEDGKLPFLKTKEINSISRIKHDYQNISGFEIWKEDIEKKIV